MSMPNKVLLNILIETGAQFAVVHANVFSVRIPFGIYIVFHDLYICIYDTYIVYVCVLKMDIYAKSCKPLELNVEFMLTIAFHTTQTRLAAGGAYA